MLAEMRADAAAHRAETATLTEKVDRGFARLEKQVAELDADVERHMDAHATLEKEVAALKRGARPAPRPARPRRARSR